MAVAFGLSPLEVERAAEELPEVVDAMRHYAAERWTSQEELLAGIYELTHANMRLLAGIGGVDKDDIPPAMRVPRPGDSNKPDRKTATGAQLAAWVANRRGGRPA